MDLNAYVHRWEIVTGVWKGTGWICPARMVVRNALLAAAVHDLPVNISAGRIRAGDVMTDNLIGLPFRFDGRVTISLALVNGESLELSGLGVTIECVGEGRYIEDLPDEFRPTAE